MMLGCPRPSGDTAPPDQDPEPATSKAPPPQAAKPCGPGKERLGAYAWLPAQAQVVASIDLTAAGSDDAIGLLSEYGRQPDSGLPIDVAFALGQWSWQVPLVQTTLTSAGFDPGELAYVRLPDGASAWLFTSTCDFDTIEANVQQWWGVQVRRTATGAVAVAADPDTKPFAYDVVFMPADRIALVPAGGATAFEQALARRPDPADLTGEASVSAAAVLAELEMAPIRLVIAPGVAVGSQDAAGLTSLRVDARGVSDASVPPLP
jgi:hypothetical protein